MTVPLLRLLAESTNFMLAHNYESVVVVDKRDGSTRNAGDHYGDPIAGLITPDERWFVSVGEGVQCFSAEGRLLTFFRRGHPPFDPTSETSAWFSDAVVLSDTHTLRVTIDPNSVESSVWQIDLITGIVTKLP